MRDERVLHSRFKIIAAVGLAQSFAAMKVLAATRIQKGHMSLHSRNIAMMAGRWSKKSNSWPGFW